MRAISDVVVPITTQVFLCTRVLISRISSTSLASLWHIVIPELVSHFPGYFRQTHNYDNLTIDCTFAHTRTWSPCTFT
ncbi:unnamed protein product [Dibothriocephalus latus]|uniref:Uncharacterized protein n=1 Tax=Dibothriocephalus latus TaxID=60516 RepID=A0A3P7M6Y0_DIBLA|nr:unnamed protein product [Dibothriocephalus latus]